MRNIFIFILCIIGNLSLWAASQKGNEQSLILDSDWQLRVHRVSNIAFSITNYGKIGSEGRDEYDPETLLPAPSCEYPQNSGIDYLYQGCLWIGAVVENPDQPSRSDTLVSIADDGWWSGINEFNPLPPGNQTIWRDNAISDEEYYAVYFDTITVGVQADPNDGRPHRPLGLKVTQHSMCWSAPGYDEFFVIDYYIENIFDRPIEDMWVGIYYDGDVMHISEDSYGIEEGSQDDLCGFVEHGDFGIGWIADNNGQPYGDFNEQSSTNVMGLYLLGSSTPGLQTNFNWWISNINSQLDWGPQWQSNFDIWHEFPGGGRGTPGGDVAKYQVMSNGEHDYDQAYSALDWTDADPAWIPNSASDPSDLANGYDTRFLISFGPLQLDAGTVETVTVAYIGGADFHTDPLNYVQHLRDHTLDSLSIAQYYANLDFSDLISKADSVLAYYQCGYDRIPLGPPADFRCVDWGFDQVSLAWQHRPHEMLQEYRIYRGTEPGVYDPEPITPSGFIDSTFTDTGLTDNTSYYYAINKVNTFNTPGGLSDEIAINTGQPTAPQGLSATRGDREIELAWQANPEDDIAGYIIYGTIFTPGCEFEVLDTALALHYADYDAINGFRHIYKLKALDVYGNASFFSDTVSAIPMGLDQGILLINSNRNDPQINPDYDSMCVFYENLFAHVTAPWQITTELPDTIADLASYGVVIFFSEYLPRPTCYFYLVPFQQLLESYLEGGGKLIVAGTRCLAPWSGEAHRTFLPDDFEYGYLNLAGIDQPNLRTSEFVGGAAAIPDFADFGLNTARVNRIVFPSDEHDGRMFGAGALTPRDTVEVIYNYAAVNPDTSSYHGRPIGIIHRTDSYTTVTLDFSLYYIEQERAFEIFNRIMREFDMTDIGQTETAALPSKTSLLKNYPNPFNPATTIKYELAAAAEVTINIYDILGRKVDSLKPGRQQAGSHAIVWDAGELPSGVYFARMSNQGRSDVLKMILLK